jgi:hypothetical protein
MSVFGVAHATACSAELGVKQRGRDVVRQGVHQHTINRDLRLGFRVHFGVLFLRG